MSQSQTSVETSHFTASPTPTPDTQSQAANYFNSFTKKVKASVAAQLESNFTTNRGRKRSEWQKIEEWEEIVVKDESENEWKEERVVVDQVSQGDYFVALPSFPLSFASVQSSATDTLGSQISKAASFWDQQTKRGDSTPGNTSDSESFIVVSSTPEEPHGENERFRGDKKNGKTRWNGGTTLSDQFRQV